jgi:hypothetical protein
MRNITLFLAYMRTAVYTAESLGMQHDGKPVLEIDFRGNNFYQIIYTDKSSRIVFSPDSKQPIAVTHHRAPQHHGRSQPVHSQFICLRPPPQP